MSPRAIVGCSMIVLGVVFAIAPLFFTVPNESAFLGVLNQKQAGDDRVSHATLYSEGKSYSVEIVQKTTTNARGEWLTAVTTLTATPQTGEPLIFRRTRTFDKGSPTENVLETPTRTIKEGRGPQGKDPYQKVILEDRSPILAKAPVPIALHAVGAVMAISGVVVVIVSRRARR